MCPSRTRLANAPQPVLRWYRQHSSQSVAPYWEQRPRQALQGLVGYVCPAVLRAAGAERGFHRQRHRLLQAVSIMSLLCLHVFRRKNSPRPRLRLFPLNLCPPPR